MALTFPRYAISLTLTHNEHKTYYETIEQWERDRSDAWVSPQQREEALRTDSVWALQWYPDTPVGFHYLLAADLDVLLDAAQKVGTP